MPINQRTISAAVGARTILRRRVLIDGFRFFLAACTALLEDRGVAEHTRGGSDGHCDDNDGRSRVCPPCENGGDGVC
ncbi:hypothetical protein GCM10022630_43090 [Thermobifida alba]